MSYYMRNIIATTKNQTELFDTRDEIKQMKITNKNWNRKNMTIEIKVIKGGRESVKCITLYSGDTLDICFDSSDVRIASLKICGDSGQSMYYLMIVDYFITI